MDGRLRCCCCCCCCYCCCCCDEEEECYGKTLFSKSGYVWLYMLYLPGQPLLSISVILGICNSQEVSNLFAYQSTNCNCYHFCVSKHRLQLLSLTSIVYVQLTRSSATNPPLKWYWWNILSSLMSSDLSCMTWYSPYYCFFSAVCKTNDATATAGA